MAQVFIGVGSNEGDCLGNLSRAIQQLGSMPGVHIVQMAPIYTTPPVGPPQPDYVNTVVEIETTRSPGELLRLVKDVEKACGRIRSSQRWGPRVIDLDILLYDRLVLRETDLTIPHAQMHLRRFVLEPLAQLAPEVVHPLLGQTVAHLLACLPAHTLSAR